MSNPIRVKITKSDAGFAQSREVAPNTTFGELFKASWGDADPSNYGIAVGRRGPNGEIVKTQPASTDIVQDGDTIVFAPKKTAGGVDLGGGQYDALTLELIALAVS